MRAGTTGVVYPRFLGIDGSGDFVWELASGRWTWGDDPHSALTRERTFKPERYVEKYGRPVPLGEQIDRQAEAELEPAESLALVAAVPVPSNVTSHYEDGLNHGAHQALMALLAVLDGWIEGARSNHYALGHRGESVGSECWTQFHPSDIRRMVNDAAREVGLSVEFADPEQATEDKVR